jgi:hypothetical protein
MGAAMLVRRASRLFLSVKDIRAAEHDSNHASCAESDDAREGAVPKQNGTGPQE